MRRHLSICVSFALASSLAAAPNGKGIDPDPKSLDVPAEIALEAKELIGKLGSKSFHEREEATRDLQKLGRMALPAIAEAMQTSANPEVQMRTELLLPSARTDDFRARIDCFLADAQGKYDHQLPGAKEFFAVTGKAEASRNLFRDIVLSPNRDLLLGVGKPDELPKIIAQRKAEFTRVINNGGGVLIINGVQQAAGKAPTIVDLAAIFFAESMLPEKQLGGAVGYQAANLLNQPALRDSLANGASKEAVAAILGKWAATREDAQTVYYAMNALKTIRPALAVKMAIMVVEVKGGVAFHRGQAIATIGQYGDAEQRAALLPILKDETVIMAGAGVGAKRVPVQARDVALAMLLLSTKQEPTDYGLTYRYKANPANDALKYNYVAYYFDGDDGEKKREEALKKWDAWHEKNKDALKK